MNAAAAGAGAGAGAAGIARRRWFCRVGWISRHRAAEGAATRFAPQGHWLAYGVPAVIGRAYRPGTLSGPAVFFLVFLPFALGHFISSLLRNVNAILAPQLMAELSLTSSQLGLLTSAYFFAFALAQLPVGVALDRFGPRRVQSAMLALAVLGALAFAGGRDLPQLLAARALMGIGLAGCFMAAVTSISTWIAPARLPSVQGYLIAAGGLGAASATLPVRLALHYTDWRWIFIALAGGCAIAALLIFLLAPTPLKAEQVPAAASAAPVPLPPLATTPLPAAPPALSAFAAAAAPATATATAPIAATAAPPALASAFSPASPRQVSLHAALVGICRNPAFRDTAMLVLLPHAVFFGIQGLWIARWLGDVARFPEQSVAWLLYLGMAAVMFGAIAVGMVTEWAARKGIAPLDVAAAGVALFIAVQCGFVLDLAPTYPLLAVLFTLVGSVTGIEYAIVAQAMPPGLTGRASTCLNLLIFLGAFAVQAGFGAITGLWPADAAQHAPAIAYRAAFGVLVLLQAAGLIRFLWRRRGRSARSGKMAAINSKEEYETGSLRPSRQREARPDR